MTTRPEKKRRSPNTGLFQIFKRSVVELKRESHSHPEVKLRERIKDTVDKDNNYLQGTPKDLKTNLCEITKGSGGRESEQTETLSGGDKNCLPETSKGANDNVILCDNATCVPVVGIVGRKSEPKELLSGEDKNFVPETSKDAKDKDESDGRSTCGPVIHVGGEHGESEQKKSVTNTDQKNRPESSKDSNVKVKSYDDAKRIPVKGGRWRDSEEQREQSKTVDSLDINKNVIESKSKCNSSINRKKGLNSTETRLTRQAMEDENNNPRKEGNHNVNRKLSFDRRSRSDLMMESKDEKRRSTQSTAFLAKKNVKTQSNVKTESRFKTESKENASPVQFMKRNKSPIKIEQPVKKSLCPRNYNSNSAKFQVSRRYKDTSVFRSRFDYDKRQTKPVNSFNLNKDKGTTTSVSTEDWNDDILDVNTQPTSTGSVIDGSNGRNRHQATTESTENWDNDSIDVNNGNLPAATGSFLGRNEDLIKDNASADLPNTDTAEDCTGDITNMNIDGERSTSVDSTRIHDCVRTSGNDRMATGVDRDEDTPVDCRVSNEVRENIDNNNDSAINVSKKNQRMIARNSMEDSNQRVEINSEGNQRVISRETSGKTDHSSNVVIGEDDGHSSKVDSDRDDVQSSKVHSDGDGGHSSKVDSDTDDVQCLRVVSDGDRGHSSKVVGDRENGLSSNGGDGGHSSKVVGDADRGHKSKVVGVGNVGHSSDDLGDRDDGQSSKVGDGDDGQSSEVFGNGNGGHTSKVVIGVGDHTCSLGSMVVIGGDNSYRSKVLCVEDDGQSSKVIGNGDDDHSSKVLSEGYKRQMSKDNVENKRHNSKVVSEDSSRFIEEDKKPLLFIEEDKRPVSRDSAEDEVISVKVRKKSVQAGTTTNTTEERNDKLTDVSKHDMYAKFDEKSDQMEYATVGKVNGNNQQFDGKTPNCVDLLSKSVEDAANQNAEKADNNNKTMDSSVMQDKGSNILTRHWYHRAKGGRFKEGQRRPSHLQAKDGQLHTDDKPSNSSDSPNKSEATKDKLSKKSDALSKDGVKKESAGVELPTKDILNNDLERTTGDSSTQMKGDCQEWKPCTEADGCGLQKCELMETCDEAISGLSQMVTKRDETIEPEQCETDGKTSRSKQVHDKNGVSKTSYRDTKEMCRICNQGKQGETDIPTEVSDVSDDLEKSCDQFLTSFNGCGSKREQKSVKCKAKLEDDDTDLTVVPSGDTSGLINAEQTVCQTKNKLDPSVEGHMEQRDSCGDVDEGPTVGPSESCDAKKFAVLSRYGKEIKEKLQTLGKVKKSTETCTVQEKHKRLHTLNKKNRRRMISEGSLYQQWLKATGFEQEELCDPEFEMWMKNLLEKVGIYRGHEGASTKRDQEEADYNFDDMENDLRTLFEISEKTNEFEDLDLCENNTSDWFRNSDWDQKNVTTKRTNRNSGGLQSLSNDTTDLGSLNKAEDWETGLINVENWVAENYDTSSNDQSQSFLYPHVTEGSYSMGQTKGQDDDSSSDNSNLIPTEASHPSVCDSSSVYNASFCDSDSSSDIAFSPASQNTSSQPTRPHHSTSVNESDGWKLKGDLKQKLVRRLHRHDPMNNIVSSESDVELGKANGDITRIPPVAPEASVSNRKRSRSESCPVTESNIDNDDGGGRPNEQDEQPLYAHVNDGVHSDPRNCHQSRLGQCSCPTIYVQYWVWRSCMCSPPKLCDIRNDMPVLPPYPCSFYERHKEHNLSGATMQGGNLSRMDHPADHNVRKASLGPVPPGFIAKPAFDGRTGYKDTVHHTSALDSPWVSEYSSHGMTNIGPQAWAQHFSPEGIYSEPVAYHCPRYLSGLDPRIANSYPRDPAPCLQMPPTSHLNMIPGYCTPHSNQGHTNMNSAFGEVPPMLRNADQNDSSLETGQCVCHKQQSPELQQCCISEGIAPREITSLQNNEDLSKRENTCYRQRIEAKIDSKSGNPIHLHKRSLSNNLNKSIEVKHTDVGKVPPYVPPHRRCTSTGKDQPDYPVLASTNANQNECSSQSQYRFTAECKPSPFSVEKDFSDETAENSSDISYSVASQDSEQDFDKIYHSSVVSLYPEYLDKVPDIPGCHPSSHPCGQSPAPHFRKQDNHSPQLSRNSEDSKKISEKNNSYSTKLTPPKSGYSGQRAPSLPRYFQRSRRDQDWCVPKSSLSEWKTNFKAKSDSYHIPYIDSHCHIDFLFNRLNFTGGWSDFVNLNKETFPTTFEGCVAVFCHPGSFKEDGLWTKVATEENVWLTFGCHPKNATEFTSWAEEGLRKCLLHKKVVALGEIGLDYSGMYKQHMEIQKMVFKKQLKLAIEMNKPLVIHCRDAVDDCLKILEEMVPRNHKIHCHCFTGNFRSALRWLDLFPNLYIGLTPLVTYLTAIGTHGVARDIPLKRLLLETDAPYFVPRKVPKELMRLSHPGMAITVAETVADFKQIDVKDVLIACRQNTKHMYGI